MNMVNLCGASFRRFKIGSLAPSQHQMATKFDSRLLGCQDHPFVAGYLGCNTWPTSSNICVLKKKLLEGHCFGHFSACLPQWPVEFLRLGRCRHLASCSLWGWCLSFIASGFTAVGPTMWAVLVHVAVLIQVKHMILIVACCAWSKKCFSLEGSAKRLQK